MREWDKLQNPNLKIQTNPNFQISKSKTRRRCLEFGDWSLFGFWVLEFEISAIVGAWG
jgi:hypothetical protein